MNYKLIIIGIICIFFKRLNAETLDSLLIKSDSINKHLSETINKPAANINKNLRIITDEVCFQSRVKIMMINELKDSLLFNHSDVLKSELDNLIIHEKALLELSRTKDTILNIISSIRAAMLADSIFSTLENIDGAIKCKTDSIYTNAIFINNYSTKREIILMSGKSKVIILLFCWLFAIFSAFILSWSIIKSKYNSIWSYIFLISLIIFSFILFRPAYIYPWLGEKVLIPAWEFNTLEGHRWDDLFMNQCKEENDTKKLKESAIRALKNYYRAAYTSVNMEQERNIYKKIEYLNTILYPPCPCPDSIEISKLLKFGKGNINFNPAWFSNYNYSKINSWNTILKNGQMHGNKINQKYYNARLSYLANDHYQLMEVKENTDRIKSPVKRMKLDLLLKVKAVL